MNFYEHHLGDYDADTAHLTWDEDLAYRRLICLYYRREEPLPADVGQLCRLARASTGPQRKAVEAVLQEFFDLRDDGWHQLRCDREIADYKAGEPERDAKKTNESIRLKRHREERADLFRRLNAGGLHAGWNTPIEKLRAMVAKMEGRESPESAAPETKAATVPATPETQTATPPATAPATPATATQTPLPITHYPLPTSQNPVPEDRDERGDARGDKPRGRASPPPDPASLLSDVDQQVRNDWLAIRAKKRLPLTQTAHDEVRAQVVKAGLTMDEALRICCRKGWASFEANWDWRSGTSNGNGAAPPANRQSALEERNRLAVQTALQEAGHAEH